MLEIRNLTKKFGKTIAVNTISFTVLKGKVVGLLGPNGAGKSTTIEMVLGLIEPTSGTIEIFGKNISTHREEVLSRINYSSAYIQFMSRLTVFENLKVFAMLYNVKQKDKKIRSIAEELEITDLLNTLFFKLSSGQKTRIVFAKTLLNDPEFLLLDEPTASLDPDIAFKVRELLQKINRERGVSMLYTSHNMAEVEEMCDRVIFLSHGQIVANDTPDKLTKLIPDHQLMVTFEHQPEGLESFIKEKQLEAEITDNCVHITATNEAIPGILGSIYQRGFRIRDISIEEPNLEDVFLKIARDTH